MSLLLWLNLHLRCYNKHSSNFFGKFQTPKNSFWNSWLLASLVLEHRILLLLLQTYKKLLCWFLFPKGLENKLYFQYNKKVPKKVSAALNPERHLVEHTGAAKKIIWHRLYISSNRFAQSFTQSGSFWIQKMMRCGEHTWSKKRSIVYITD